MTANYYPDLSEWRSVSERVDQLGISMDRYVMSSIGVRALSAWRKKNLNEPPRRLTKRSAGKRVSVYPPSFFAVIDEMIEQEKSVKAVSDRKWSLFEDDASVAGKKPANADAVAKGQITKIKKLAARDSLVHFMSEKLGMNDFQIAHTYIKDKSGRSFIVPGMEHAPSDLANAAKKYIVNYRGGDPGPLIRRLLVRSSVDKNQPMDPKDIGKIRAQWSETLEAKKRIDAELIAEQKQREAIKEQEIRDAKDSADAIDASVPASKDAPARRDTSEPLTSISIPRALLDRLRLLSAVISAEEGRRVSPYELVERAINAIECFGFVSKSSSEDIDKERRA